MTNLTHISFLCIYFNSVHVSSNPVLIIRRINCINTTSGICHCVSLTVSCAGREGTSRPVHETVRNFPTCTRNGHRDRVTYTRGCIDKIDSPDDGHGVARISDLHTKRSPRQSDIYQRLY